MVETKANGKQNDKLSRESNTQGSLSRERHRRVQIPGKSFVLLATLVFKNINEILNV